MDKNANVYRAPEDEIPVEDKARLDGYLAAKAEDGELERMKAEVEALQAKIRDENPPEVRKAIAEAARRARQEDLGE
jgi:cell division protein FtsB